MRVPFSTLLLFVSTTMLVSCISSPTAVIEETSITRDATPAPKTLDPNLYKINCASCHGLESASEVRGASAADISSAISKYPQMKHLRILTAEEVDFIASLLKDAPAAPVPTPTPVPPTTVNNGATLYKMNCATCHGPLESSDKKDTNLGNIVEGIKSVSKMKNLAFLTTAELEMIVSVLSPNPIPGVPSEDPGIASWDKLAPKQCEPAALSTSTTLIDKEQYRDIISDVFGMALDTSALPDKEAAFYNRGIATSGATVQDQGKLDKLFALAFEVATFSEKNFTSVVSRFGSCTVTEVSCQNQIILNLLTKLFRRDVTASDAEFTAIVAKFPPAATFKERFKSVIVAGLMNPRFLFILEYKQGLRATGAADLARSVDHFELAQRMAFLIWNSIPDVQLFEAARTGRLATPSERQVQVKRMLADPKAERMVKRFTHEWLGTSYLEKIHKDPKFVPGFSKTLMEKMKTETELLVLEKFRNRHDFRTYFTAGETYVDAALAANYGIAGVSSSTFTKVLRTPETLQAGLLSQGSYAAATSEDSTDPIIRGLHTYRLFLCGQLGNPPDNAAQVEFDDNSKFGQLTGRAALASCKGCHNRFDSYGYTMEALSPIGKLRSIDEFGDQIGYAVSLYGRNITSLKEAGVALSENPKVGACLSEQLTRYTIRGALATDARTDCHFENISHTAYTKGNSFKDYVEALVLSPLFLTKQEEK